MESPYDTGKCTPLLYLGLRASELPSLVIRGERQRWWI
jgi:hypothetical protein